jgi:HEAT repeat protein
LQNTNLESRQNAIWQLGEKGDSRAIEPLVNLLRDSDSKQQSLILTTLSQIGNKTLKPMVRALSLSLQNDNQEVRVNAIRDLTDVYEVVISISNILQYAVDDPDDKVRETAKWALEKLNRIRPPRNLDL